MTIIANVMNSLFDTLVAPFGNAAAWAMTILSGLIGLLMLLLFKASTNQKKLATAKRHLLGHLYEMGLYQENLRVLFRIQGDLAKANLRYLSVTLPALVTLIVPVVLILAQLDSRFAHRPFLPRETALVTATVAAGQDELLDDLTLLAPEAVAVETLPVRDYDARTITWRVRVLAEGTHELILTTSDGSRWTKQLAAGDGLPRLAANRERAGWHHALLNPAEAPLPKDSPVLNIALQLRARETHYAGIRLNWLVAFCILSLVFGFALKDLFKVQI